jgi:SAM-dependent methyltransferase
MSAIARRAETSVAQDLLGAVVAKSLTLSREQVAETAIALLAVQPDSAVLELGCGSGHLLFRLAARLRRGLSVGVDPSEWMVRHARHRNRHWIRAGRAAVCQAGSADLGQLPAGHFDAVLGVHVVCFWSRPERDLAEVKRVLRPGGRLLLGFRSEVAASGPDPSRLPPQRVEAWLRDAGFAEVRREQSRRGDASLAWVGARR